MAKVAVPVIQLKYDEKDAYSNEIHDIFLKAGVWNPIEQFTFTGRVTLDANDPDSESKRKLICSRLEAALGADEAARLVELLNSNNWDVSFFVDCW